MRNFVKQLLGALLLLWCASSVEATYLKYKDPKQPLNVRINDLMKQMTFDEKIGQMAQIDREVGSTQIMKDYFIGSVLSQGGSVPKPKAIAEDWMKMVDEFQNGSLSTRLGIPMIYGIDAIHGNNNVYKATIFPHNVGLGATRDPELVKKIGAATALEVRATGIQYVFAPCVAVCRDPRWGRCYESYGEDTKLVQEMTELIPGIQGDLPANYPKGVPYVAGKHKVAACAKHYVGDGGTFHGINENNTIISRHGLLSIHMPPYYNSMIKDVSTIMVSYSSWNGVKMHANHELITSFLKNTLKFKGLVISDSQGIDRITYPAGINYTYSVQVGVNAGIDMEHRELAREAVRKSLVLLKNGKYKVPLLPLPKKANKILVAGSHAHNIGLQCGGWTIEWHGASGNITAGTTILDAIKSTIDPSTKVVFSKNPSHKLINQGDFSYSIIVVGEPPYAETQGDNMNLTLPAPGPALIKNVCASVKCVVIIISGRPLVIEKYVPKIDALVAAWLPGTEGKGVTDVLFGDYGFSGRLPRTWFRTVDQLPMNVGDRHYDPLFPFGFGLSTVGRYGILMDE